MANQKRRKKILWIILIALIAGGIFSLIWFFIPKSVTKESEIISREGIHWHVNLVIKINGEIQEIPENIGMVPQETPIHTHSKDGVIHMEFPGLVKIEDIKFGKFFEIWGKKFNKDCIFDKCSGAEGQLKMFVNEKLNFEFENYTMRNGDKIEIIFEKEEKATGAIKEITVAGTEFSFSPFSITVLAGEKIKLTFKNNGRAPHNLIIEGLGIGTKTIGGGRTDTIEFTAPASGTFTFFCLVPGHRSSGMEGQLMVE